MSKLGGGLKVEWTVVITDIRMEQSVASLVVFEIPNIGNREYLGKMYG